MKGRTTVLITHREELMRAADRVVVLDGGRIVGEGGRIVAKGVPH